VSITSETEKLQSCNAAHPFQLLGLALEWVRPAPHANVCCVLEGVKTVSIQRDGGSTENRGSAAWPIVVRCASSVQRGTHRVTVVLEMLGRSKSDQNLETRKVTNLQHSAPLSNFGSGPKMDALRATYQRTLDPR
jgi:hypothetical protein